jgi:hypothetical protein
MREYTNFYINGKWVAPLSRNFNSFYTIVSVARVCALGDGVVSRRFGQRNDSRANVKRVNAHLSWQ